MNNCINPPYRPALLDVPISLFEYDQTRNAFANVSARTTTLRRMVSTQFYRQPIEAIRAETDKAAQDEQKKLLPAYTPVARLNHRKRDTGFAEKISQQWPVLMGDVDKKDNPDLDMAELKKHLCRLPYLLLCAYSVRGGLWFVVRLPDDQTPETLAAHFRYLQKLFSRVFGVVLDSTKGGNPTDLRFVSYDPEPYINDNATVMTGTYTPPKPKPKPRPHVQHRFNQPDEGKLLARLVRFVEGAGEGERHTTLLKAARLAGGYVAGGCLDEQNAVYGLETAASEWPNFSKSQKTIRDGIRYGLQQPIYEDAPYAQAGYVTPSNNTREPLTRPAASSTAQPADTQQRVGFVAPPMAWDADEVYRFVRYTVIPDGYDEANWPPQDETINHQ